MKKTILFLFALYFTSCNVKPEPLVAGKDVCSSCKMPVSDIRFGAEIITEKGRIYKFDDVICLVNFFREEMGAKEKAKEILVVSYSDSQKLISSYDSYFLVSDELHSPMNSGTASFHSRKEAELFQKNFPGQILSWEELNQTFN